MDFYFCVKYIYTDGDEKKVERDMYVALLCFRGSNDHIGYEEWENILEAFFSYYILTSEEKYYYAQMKQVGHAYWWWKDSHIDDQYWFVLQDHLRSLYAPYFFMHLRQITMILMLRARARELIIR